MEKICWPFYTIRNLKYSSTANHDDRHMAPSLFKICGSAPAYCNFHKTNLLKWFEFTK